MNPALTKLQAIEQAATKGPWEVVASRDVLSAVVCPGVQTIAIDFERDSDATFVCSARNALPALIAALVEIEQLADDCNGKRINIGPRQIQNIIAKHLEPLK